jgi:hypothetical protein
MLVCFVKLLAKLPHLLFEFLDGFQPWIIIYHWAVCDKRCFCGIGESRDIFLQKHIIWINTRYHQAIAIPPY